MTAPESTVYRMLVTCGCDGGRPAEVFTDGAGAALLRQDESLCPTCWCSYVVAEIRTATAREVADHPLPDVPPDLITEIPRD